jgi:BASS family bile acid:Na+ symporter
MAWFYEVSEFYLTTALTVCAMFGMGATLTVRDFLAVLRAPQSVLLVMAMQVLVTPLLAIGLSRLFQLDAGVAVGLLLVSALPGGLFSNVLSYLGRGNMALSISATAVSTLACLVTTTFVLTTFGQEYFPAEFEMPVGSIISTIGLFLLLPLAAGMVVRRHWPRHHQMIAKSFIRLSVVLLFALIVAGLASNRISPFQYGWRSPAAMVVFSTVSIWLCYLFGVLIRMPLANSFTVCIEVVVRNVHLGVLLKSRLFPAGTAESDAIGYAVLYVILVYGIISLCYGCFEIVSRNRGWGLHSPRCAHWADSAAANANPKGTQ